MSEAIYKYTVTPGQRHLDDVKRGARFLTAQMQRGAITLWAVVDPKQPTESIAVSVVGTGWDLQGDLTGLRYLNTVQTNDGAFVWHVFVSAA